MRPFSAARTARCAAGSADGLGASQASSPAANRSNSSTWWVNMASMTPGAKTPSRTSQFTSTPPSNSVTWASSSTWGPCEMIHPGVPNCSVTSGQKRSPSPSALVNTTGASTWVPRWRLRSRSTDSPGYALWPAALRRASCTACARAAAVRAPVRSTSSNSEEVKSPTSRSTSGCRAWRLNNGRFSRNRDDADQRASTLAKAAASVIAGVMPRARARANNASRVCGSSQCQRRVLRRRSRSPPARVGSAGGSGSCGMRCAHQSRSASRTGWGSVSSASIACRYSR
ncbi:Uncharacterised protein [Mycobacterium tuberculosis]|nr:Uncharacterised protein [Mycobacterium tuberculosis]